MNLIAILICLALQKLADINNTFLLKPFEKYLGGIKKLVTKLNPWVGLTIIVAPFIIVLLILHIFTAQRLLGLPYLIISCITLFLAMNARDLERSLNNYFLAVRENDSKKIKEEAEKFCGCKIDGNVYRKVSQTIFKRAFNDLFAPLFWFMIFGFYSVTIYCLIATTKKRALAANSEYDGIVKAASLAKSILDWIPIRLVALTFALAGHFSIAFGHWYKKIFTTLDKQQEFNIDSGLAALDSNLDEPDQADIKENNFALQLVNRALVVWLIALTLFTLGGWLT